ncbi:MAG: hypothetical protein NTX48_02970, partial [Planctomycetales bacterium]|nr:hypothetical protein [Planctomycetales bacterium]
MAIAFLSIHLDAVVSFAIEKVPAMNGTAAGFFLFAAQRKVPLGLQREFCEEFRRKAKQVFGGPSCDTILP